ncbi:MAG TPA: DUF6286 domain-containing protein [Acidimicrobiales bacterium]
MLPAIVCALVLGGLGVTVAIDVVAVQTAGHAVIWPYEQLAHDVRTTTWRAGAVEASAIGAIVVGALLVIGAFVPGRRKLLIIETTNPDELVGLGPRSFRRTLGTAAAAIDGVGRVNVELGHRRVSVEIITPLRDPTGLDVIVRTALERRLSELHLSNSPRLAAVRVRHRQGSLDEVPPRAARPTSAPPVPSPGTGTPSSGADDGNSAGVDATAELHTTSGADVTAGSDETSGGDRVPDADAAPDAGSDLR